MARPGATDEDDGWLLVVVFDAESKRDGLHIYDARALDAGPCAVAWSRRSTPYGLHGAWVGETFGVVA